MAVTKIDDSTFKIGSRVRDRDGARFSALRIALDEDGDITASYRDEGVTYIVSIAIEDAPDAVAAMQALIGGAS